MKRMPSLLDIAGLLFGGFGLAMGAFFVVGGIIGFFDGISWIAIAIGPLFLWFGGSTIRQQFSWLTHYRCRARLWAALGCPESTFHSSALK
jgi:hypothetical protein